MLEVWSQFTSLPKEKKGMAVFLTLKGADQEAVLELDTNEITGENGLENVIARLDKLYLKDETLQKYKAFEKFEIFKRSNETPINDFILKFEKKYHKLKSYGTTISDDLLAFRLLKSANLSPADEKLAKGTAKLEFDAMKDQLKKLFSENSSFPSSNMERVEDIKFSENAQESENFTYYSRNRPYRGRGRYTPSNRGSGGPSQLNWRQPRHQPQFNEVSSRSNQERNPKNEQGVVSRCTICDSTMHWAPNCPHKSNGVYLASEYEPSQQTSDESYQQELLESITLFQTDLDSPSELPNLVSDAFNCALIDCGASKTVCGKAWFDVLIESLSEEQQNQVRKSKKPSLKTFKFGNGKKFPSIGNYIFPAKIGSKNISIQTDVIESDIPLLFSRESLSKAEAVLNMKSHRIEFLGEKLPMTLSKSGHYLLPITSRSSLALNPSSKNLKISLVSENKSKQDIALKLHRQFAHCSAERLIKLLKSAGSPWDSDTELFEQIQALNESCQTCLQYQQPKPRPVVGLPTATRFGEKNAMDLKFYDLRIILHMIDHATRFSMAAAVPNKKPETIVRAMFSKWIGIFGAPDKLITDNGGEFVNKELIDLAESFNMTIQTTAAEAPWSNGLVERHNKVIEQMLDKILADTKCNFEIALQWAINAKNSLSNVHGFSPYQLVLGNNPKLPSVLSDKPPAFLSDQKVSQILEDNLKSLHAAREAFIQAESSAKIRRALNSNTRTYSDEVYTSGDSVYYKRQQEAKWRGPAKVLGQDGQFVLLKHGGYYVRVHPCRLMHCKPSSTLSKETTEDASIENKLPHHPAGNLSPEIENKPKAVPEFDTDSDEDDEQNDKTINLIDFEGEVIHPIENQNANIQTEDTLPQTSEDEGHADQAKSDENMTLDTTTNEQQEETRESEIRKLKVNDIILINWPDET